MYNVSDINYEESSILENYLPLGRRDWSAGHRVVYLGVTAFKNHENIQKTNR